MSKILMEGMAFAMPLLIMAVGAIFSEKSGVTNLAVEGFQGVGAFCGALTAVFLMPRLGQSSQAVVWLAMAAAFAGGAVYAVLHALLCITFKANQVISGVVVNIVAEALTVFLTSEVNAVLTGSASNKFVLGVAGKVTIPVISRIPVIGALFRDMYQFELVIIAIVAFSWYLIYRTRYGMHMRACGENPQAVAAAGGNVTRIRFISVLISGGLSGLGGICFAYSISTQFSPSIYMGFGYLAIAAMIFGNWNILPTVGACLLFGFARSGGYQLCLAMKLPSIYSDLFMLVPYILTLLLLLLFSRKNRAPAAVGSPYDPSRR